MRLIVQDNLWFSGAPGFANYVLDGKTMIPVEPLQGRTSSADLEAKGQELQWLLRYTGRGGSGLVVAQEWIRPGDPIDRNLGPWLRIFERHGRRAKWCIFYDPVLAVRQRGLGTAIPFDFSSAELLKLWRSDLDHLEPYFSHPKYWQVDGRPVLYVWAVHGGIANAGRAFGEAEGRGLYVLGDVFGGRREPANMRGVTGFVSAVPGLVGAGDHRRVTELIPSLEQEFRHWARRGFRFIPAASLQYDDTEFQIALGADGQEPVRLLAHDRADLRRLLEFLRGWARSGEVLLGTANGWAEGTTILPTARAGPEFGSERIGHYRFAHLEAIRNTLFPGVSEYAGPRVEIRRRRRRKVRLALEDVDLRARIRTRPRSALLADKLRSGFARRLVVEPGATLTVRNLDGRRARITL